MDMGDPLAMYVFVLANVLITAGYLFLALVVVPKVSIQLLRTKIGGIGFFLLCGATHLHMAAAAITDDSGHTYSAASTSWWMLAIHVPQAICVWLFVTGLYIEIGDFGLLRTKEAVRRERAGDTSLDAGIEQTGPVDKL